MPPIVELLSHMEDGQEERSQGSAKIMMKFLFVAGRKLDSLRKQICPPETLEPGVLRLRFAENRWRDLRFRSPAEAEDFEAQSLEIYNETLGKGKAQAKLIEIPGAAATRSERADPAPAKSSRPLSEFSGGRHDFEVMSQTSRLPGSASTPMDAAAREAKRRHIDSHCTTLSGTPEKVGRTLPQQTPLRAPAPRSSLLTVGPKRPAAPQGSSSYGGYRSSLTFGLRNLGNTCYLNAVMQACCSLRELVSDLRGMGKTLPPCQDGPLYRCTVEILHQMSLASRATGPLSPTKLREHIALAAPMFRGNEQQDAHEFFLEFVNQLHDELLGARNQWLKQAPEADDAAVLATQLHLDSEVQKRLVCISCQNVREVHERFRDFSLDFCRPVDGERCSLTRMLRAYFDSEVLEAKCERCNDIAANMDKHLTSPPRVLVLHLKRFTPNLEKQRYEKQHQSVDIPTRLDLNAIFGSAAAAAAEGHSPLRLPARPLAAAAAAASSAAAARSGGADAAAGGEARAASPSRGPASRDTEVAAPAQGTPGLWYSLRAVVGHDGGSPHCGHYTCYARGEDGMWRLYDDSIVREVPDGQDLKRVLGRLAYIVFYVLQAPDAKV